MGNILFFSFWNEAYLRESNNLNFKVLFKKFKENLPSNRDIWLDRKDVDSFKLTYSFNEHLQIN